jgi:hypothetical protein
MVIVDARPVPGILGDSHFLMEFFSDEISMIY